VSAKDAVHSKQEETDFMKNPAFFKPVYRLMLPYALKKCLISATPSPSYS